MSKTNPKKEDAPVSEEREMSPEELKKLRLNLYNYYVEQNKVLKVQAEFEKYHADIAEDRARNLYNQIRHAQMAAGPKDAPAGEPTKRSLKKED